MSNSSRLANKLTTTLTNIKKNKNSKISKKLKQKTNPPSYKKSTYTLTYPDPKVKPDLNPEPELKKPKVKPELIFFTKDNFVQNLNSRN